jgi:hypothetical protein
MSRERSGGALQMIAPSRFEPRSQLLCESIDAAREFGLYIGLHSLGKTKLPPFHSTIHWNML